MRRTGNTNACDAVAGDLQYEMDLFDRLPAHVRDALNEAWFKWSVPDIIDRMAFTGQRGILSFLVSSDLRRHQRLGGTARETYWRLVDREWR